jgi:hypothetical protein
VKLLNHYDLNIPNTSADDISKNWEDFIRVPVKQLSIRDPFFLEGHIPVFNGA